MHDEFSRTSLLLGDVALSKLEEARVIIFGVGGVGGYVAEALARSGIGHIALVDNDSVSLSNINRQIIALHTTIGQPKVLVMKERILDINPCCEVMAFEQFFDVEHLIDITGYDYVVDCIDTVSSKLLLIEEAVNANIKIISSMGTGNKLNPSELKVADISKTSVCPLARVMRTNLRKKGINHLKVVYSQEEPKGAVVFDNGRHAPGSISFVPSVAGMLIASEVVKDLIEE